MLSRIGVYALGVVGLLCGPVHQACGDQQTATGEPIVVGCIFCLTGEIAAGCNSIREGAEVAVDSINAAGGIHGRPLRLDIQDSGNTPRGAHTAAKRFARGFADTFAKGGGVITFHQEVTPDEADFRALLIRALESKPDVIYAPVTAHLASFFRQARQLGFAGPILTSDNLTDELVSHSGGAFEGAYQTMVAAALNDQSKQLGELYRRKFNKEPGMLAFHGWGYDGVRLVAEALQRSEIRRESIRRGLLSIKDFPGAGGVITFSHEGSWRMPLRVYQVKHGRLVLIQ